MIAAQGIGGRGDDGNCGRFAGSLGFSGLARGFRHTELRSLLVSNWSIASDATVELTTGFLAALHESPNMTRAEALQRSMLKMLDSGNASFTHPAFWAPFVVVGD